MKKIKNTFEYYIHSFAVGAFALAIFCFLGLANSFQKGVLIVVLGASVFSLIYGSLLLITNKYLRPKIYKYFFHHKNIKSLEKLGFDFNNTMNCYFETYRDYDVQVLCYFDKINFLETDYVINIFFDKIEVRKVKQIRKKEIFDKYNLAEFFIQKVFTFKFFPPSEKELIDSINSFIDLLKRNKLKPVRLKDLGEEFNNVT